MTALTHRLLALAASIALCGCAANAHAQETYDLWIRGGLVHDGNGAAPIEADVLIRGDRIVRLGVVDNAAARRVIEARGKIVAPGFIDTHSHGDPLIDASFENFVLQGVTSVLLGQDGASPGFGDEASGESRKSVPQWLTAMEQARLQTNVATLIGHGTLRWQSGVGVAAQPTAVQMQTMQTLLREALQAGAFGMSSGLEYVPGRYAQREELTALARTVGQHGRLVVSHMRSEDSDKVMDALEELLMQGEHARVHVSHLKIVFPRGVEEGDRVVAALDAARARGVHVTADVYPYLAGYGDLSLVYPPWAKTKEEWARAVANDRPRLEAYLRERIALRGGPQAILLAEAPYTNQTLAQAAERLQQPAEKVVIDVMGYGGPSAAHFNMREDVQDRFLSWAHASIATDGGPKLQHPRSWGTYPKTFATLVRERKVLSMEEAIRKMTSLPASIIGLAQRGALREGNYADVVIFTPDAVRDTATWDRFAQPPAGIDHVVVNGCVQVENSRMTPDACGRLLRSPGARKEDGASALSGRG